MLMRPPLIEQEVARLEEQKSNSREMLNILEQQEKKFQMQEDQRKERIKANLLDKTKVLASYYTTSTKEYVVSQYM